MKDPMVEAWLESYPSRSRTYLPVMVNACTGKMGKAFIGKAEKYKMYVVPVSFSSEEKSGETYLVCGKEFLVQGPSSRREKTLATILDKYPELIIVDFTVPSAVNANAELYCKVGVPFVMGTNGGDRERLYSTVYDSKVYALIAPQMGKQVAAFCGAMQILADSFPGAFWGYSLNVLESQQQQEEVGASDTAKSVIPCFDSMGVIFDADKIESIRDPEVQREVVGVPEEHLSAHACRLFALLSPDETAEFHAQHAVFGRSMYAEGTAAAVHFLDLKVQLRDKKKVYTIYDVMAERDHLKFL